MPVFSAAPLPKFAGCLSTITPGSRETAEKISSYAGPLPSSTMMMPSTSDAESSVTTSSSGGPGWYAGIRIGSFIAGTCDLE